MYTELADNASVG